MIITLEVVDDTEVLVCQCVQADVPTGRREREGALAGGDGLIIGPSVVAIDRLKDEDLPQPTRIIEGRGAGFSLAEIGQDTPMVAGRQERRAQGKPEIDSLLACVM